MAKEFGKIEIPVAAASFGGALQGFVWDRYVRGENVQFGADVTKVIGIDPNNQPTFDQLVSIVSNGGRFTGVKLAIEFASVAAAQQTVPPTVRGASYIDEEEVEQFRTFVQWLKASTSANIITNGTLYIAKANFNGKLLTSEELVAIHQLAGVKVIEWADAQARYADEAYTVYEL